LDKKVPGNQDKHAARSFLFSWERKRVEKKGKWSPGDKKGRRILVLMWPASEEKTTCSRAHVGQRRWELGLFDSERVESARS
jgi:hypothetical protein